MTAIRDFTPVRRDRSSVLIGLAGGSSSGQDTVWPAACRRHIGETPRSPCWTLRAGAGSTTADLFPDRFEHRDLEPPLSP